MPRIYSQPLRLSKLKTQPEQDAQAWYLWLTKRTTRFRNTSHALLLCGLALSPARVFAQELLTHKGDADSTYTVVLNETKREGLQIESASKDAGIKTGLIITGRYKQTGTHYEFTFISGPTETTVRVVAYEQRRYKALSTEPWSTPKVNDSLSRSKAEAMKAGLGW